MKIHVILKDEIIEELSDKYKDGLGKYFENEYKLDNVNIDHFQKYGIISGELSDRIDIKELEQHDDIEHVELNGIRTIGKTVIRVGKTIIPT